MNICKLIVIIAFLFGFVSTGDATAKVDHPDILFTFDSHAGTEVGSPREILAKGKRPKQQFQRVTKPSAKPAKPVATLRKPLAGQRKPSVSQRFPETQRILRNPAVGIVASRSSAAKLTHDVRKHSRPVVKAQAIVKLRASKNQSATFDFRSVGPYLPPAVKPRADQRIPLSKTSGRQSRKSGQFKDVKLSSGRGATGRYLWTIDRRGINIALERTPVGRSKEIKHTNLSRRASIGGEAWFVGKNHVVINGGSGRFGDGNIQVSKKNFHRAVEAWRHLGYNVTVVPFNAR